MRRCKIVFKIGMERIQHSITRTRKNSRFGGLEPRLRLGSDSKAVELTRVLPMLHSLQL